MVNLVASKSDDACPGSTERIDEAGAHLAATQRCSSDLELTESSNSLLLVTVELTGSVHVNQLSSCLQACENGQQVYSDE